MDKKVMKLAPHGKRVAAFIIDSILPFILIILSLVATFFYYQQHSVSNMYGFEDDFFDYGMNTTISVGPFVALGICFFLYLIFVAVQIVFYTKAKTIGKAIMGLQVISSNTGEPVSVWYMILREWFAKTASAAPLYLGYIWAFIDGKHRAWHDKMIDTYVIDITDSQAFNAEKEESVETE